MHFIRLCLQSEGCPSGTALFLCLAQTGTIVSQVVPSGGTLHTASDTANPAGPIIRPSQRGRADFRKSGGSAGTGKTGRAYTAARTAGESGRPSPHSTCANAGINAAVTAGTIAAHAVTTAAVIRPTGRRISCIRHTGLRAAGRSKGSNIPLAAPGTHSYSRHLGAGAVSGSAKLPDATGNGR